MFNVKIHPHFVCSSITHLCFNIKTMFWMNVRKITEEHECFLAISVKGRNTVHWTGVLELWTRRVGGGPHCQWAGHLYFLRTDKNGESFSLIFELNHSSNMDSALRHFFFFFCSEWLEDGISRICQTPDGEAQVFLSYLVPSMHRKLSCAQPGANQEDSSPPLHEPKSTGNPVRTACVSPCGLLVQPSSLANAIS